MYQKKCPECGAYSYSAYEGTLWQCPECQTDISDVETKAAGSEEGTINGLTRRDDE